jgi:hypothetical protein
VGGMIDLFSYSRALQGCFRALVAWILGVRLALEG